MTYISIHLLGSSDSAQRRIIQLPSLVFQKDEGRGESGLLDRGEGAERGGGGTEGGAKHCGRQR